jgi:hypothetical protein
MKGALSILPFQNNMYIPFDQIADHARVWVYQANRPLTDAEVAHITDTLQPVLATWEAHGHPLTAAGQVRYNRFVVIAVDESQGLPSGCSIDKSVGWLRQLSGALGVDFLDRSATYLGTDGSVQSLALPHIKAAVADGVLTPESIVFNNLVATKAEFETNWQIPAAHSWLKRYFKVTV